MKKIKFSIAVLICFGSALISSQTEAHDFWLAPETFAPQPGKPVNIDIMIGHPTDQMSWPLDPHRIVSFRSFGPAGITDHQSAVTRHEKTQQLTLPSMESGLHILSIESTQAFSRLEASKFNSYIEEEGLTPIKLDRARHSRTDQAGTETYSRRGKALIQVGPLAEVDPNYLSKPLGMTLEIVPLNNPARLSENDMLNAQIYYRGLPINGVKVGLVDLSGDAGLLTAVISDQNGRIELKRPNSGEWMLHAVWSSAIDKSGRADYDTVFSSLSFSVP